MTKPTLLLEVEAGLDAAEKAKAELEAFDETHPNLLATYTRQSEILELTEKARRLSIGSPEVFQHLSNAQAAQRKSFHTMTPLVVQRLNLADLDYEASRAYTHVSLKWDASAERLDYLQALIYQE